MRNTLTRLKARLKQFKEERDLQIQQQLEQQNRIKEEYREARLAFQQTFDDTILLDLKGLTGQLVQVFTEHGLVLRYESHKKYDYFRPATSPIEPYIVIGIDSRKKSMRDRWKNCPHLTFESDINGGKVLLYACNESIDNIDEWDYRNLAVLQIGSRNRRMMSPAIRPASDKKDASFIGKRLFI